VKHITNTKYYAYFESPISSGNVYWRDVVVNVTTTVSTYAGGGIKCEDIIVLQGLDNIPHRSFVALMGINGDIIIVDSDDITNITNSVRHIYGTRYHNRNVLATNSIYSAANYAYVHQEKSMNLVLKYDFIYEFINLCDINGFFDNGTNTVTYC
jgi:hypothetical protein